MQPDKARPDATSGASSAARAQILSVMPKSPTLDSLSIATGQKVRSPSTDALATEIRRQFVVRSFACLPQPPVKGNARAVLHRPAWHLCTVLYPPERLEFVQYGGIAGRDVRKFRIFAD